MSLKNWQNNFLSIIEECIPKQTLPRRRNLPWMSRNLVRAMRKQNRLYKQARKHRNPSLLNCYKRERNRVVCELRRAKRDYYFRNLNPNNTKQFWKTVKLMNKQKTSIPTLNRNGMAANEDSEKANMLNQYFSECFSMAELPLANGDYCNIQTTGECPQDILCTEDEVFHMLNSLNTTKANGPDGISA